MKKTIRILTIVALAQLALIAVNYMGGSEQAAQTDSLRLLTFNPSDVDTIVIRGQQQAGVTLSKGKHWKTASGFPADGQRITTLLQRLHDLKHGLAIATSAAAPARFKVDDKHFERQLLLRQGDSVLAELFLGNGAGARHSYVRSGQDHAVYSVALGSYDLPLKEDDWQDKTILQIGADEITSVSVRGVRLDRRADAAPKKAAGDATAKGQTGYSWMNSDLPAGRQVNQDAVTHALKLLQSLRFVQVIGTVSPPDVDLNKADLEIQIAYKGKQRQYRLAKQGGGDDYVLKVSDRPEYFRVSGYAAKELVKQMNPDTWFVEKKPAGDTAKPDAAHSSPDAKASVARQPGL